MKIFYNVTYIVATFYVANFKLKKNFTLYNICDRETVVAADSCLSVSCDL